MLGRVVIAAAVLAGSVAFGTRAEASETVTYTYDAHGRVTEVVHDGGPNDGVVRSYKYDDADNRTEKKTIGA